MKSEGKTSVQLINEPATPPQRATESKVGFAVLLDHAPVMVMLVDRERHVRRINRAAATFTGRPVEEMIGLRGGEALRCLHALDSPKGCGFGPFCTSCQIRLTVIDTFETGNSHQQVVARLPIARGELQEERNLLVSTTPLDVLEDRMVLVYIEDITKRIQAEEELRKNEERFRALTESTSDWIWEVDADGIYTYASPKVEEILGYEPEEVIGQTPFDLMPPAETTRVMAEFKTIVESQTAFARLENMNLHKDGRLIVLETSGVPFFDASGELCGYRGVDRDITERKQAEEAWRKAELRYRILFEEAPVMYVITHQQEDGPIITDCNNLFLTTLGYTRAEVMHRPLAGFYTPESRTRLMEGGYQQALEGRFTAQERQLVTGDGQVVETLLRAVPETDADGKVSGTRAMFVDITERKQLEEQLRQAQKMEAIGQLAGGVAHDFNNLITVITGYCQFLRKGLNPDDPKRAYVEEINKAGDQAATLVRQLLAFSRKQVLQPEVLNLSKIVEDMEKMLGRLLGEDIELATNLDPELGPVMVDPGQLEQVIMNLAVNARDAMPYGGKLTIETTNVELDEAYVRQHAPVQSGPYVMLAVSDTGTGMDEETQARIFEPFFTTKEVGKGTGLGLATVYGIVKQSEGYIWVYSEPGQGTTFKIYLPCIEETGSSRRQEQEPSESLQGSETILLVEDSDMLRELARQSLLECGYEVLEAGQGEEALQLCAQHQGPIHLLVTDMVMPGMNGRELAERLSSLRQETKVLYTSGYMDHAIVRNGVLEPGTPFLPKPFNPDDLARKVREVLDAN